MENTLTIINTIQGFTLLTQKWEKVCFKVISKQFSML